MIRYILHIGLGLGLLLSACQHNCPLNQEEIVTFQNSVDVVESFGVADSMSLREFFDAVKFLRDKTGYEDHAYFGEVWGYFDEEVKEQDLDAWKSWFDSRCKN